MTFRVLIIGGTGQVAAAVARALVATNSKVEVAGGDTVKLSKIGIEHDFLTADQIDPACNAFDGNDGLSLWHRGIVHGSVRLSRSVKEGKRVSLRNQPYSDSATVWKPGSQIPM